MQLAEDQMALKPLKMQKSYDLWQFGIMIFEAVGGPYWPQGTTDASILHKLATPTTKLPHETEQLEPPEIRNMLQVCDPVPCCLSTFMLSVNLESTLFPEGLALSDDGFLCDAPNKSCMFLWCINNGATTFWTWAVQH
jgi:hypothetical protein